MNVDFFFDPICPWCWITSRWLNDVASDRDLTVNFKPFSLAIKNNVLDPNTQGLYAEASRSTHRLLRVVESVRKEYGDDAAGQLYTEIGRKIHVDGEKTTEWISFLLDSLKLDTAHAEAADDEAFDSIIEASMDEAFAAVGTDVGVPIIKTDTKSGPQGFFGPVISVLPEHEEGLALWDGISAMISYPSFFELKRTREAAPDTVSTARVFEN